MHQKKSLVLILVKQIQKFGWVYIIMLNLFVYRKEIFKFKANNENDNSLTQFRVGNIPNGFSASESREISLNGNVYDFSVDYNSIDKSDK